MPLYLDNIFGEELGYRQLTFFKEQGVHINETSLYLFEIDCNLAVIRLQSL